MKKQFLAIPLVILLGAVPAFALAAGSNPADAYFSAPNPTLTPQEKTAVALAQKWQAASATGIKPVAGPGGSVRFIYGAQPITVVCAVLLGATVDHFVPAAHSLPQALRLVSGTVP